MKSGVSSYSYNQAMADGRLTAYEVIDEAARQGFAGLDIAVFHTDEPVSQAAGKIRKRAADAGIKIVNYAVGADILKDGVKATVGRVRAELDTAAAMGAATFRSDASSGFREGVKRQVPFMDALPEIAEAYRSIAEYGETLGIRTTIENHGLYSQDSERVEAIIRTVGHPNFGALLDVGNFACADEDSVQATARLLPYAFHVHAKDFHIKPACVESPGRGWFRTRSGRHLRGAIIGHGDIPVAACLKMLRDSGYDGVCAIEFEGIEDCLMAIAEGKQNLDKMLIG